MAKYVEFLYSKGYGFWEAMCLLGRKETLQ